ncbi:MAG: hypothetical protein GY842_16590, partial [bacterium]|nr:hypothetical protein [bacterium]
MDGHISRAATLVAPPGLGLGGWLLLRAARRANRRAAQPGSESCARTTDASAYGRWRDESLRRQLTDHFHPDRLRGKDVLDFGCGTGELSMLLAAQY